ncbi:MAG TPA: OmpA family protein, partial [Polyangiaceae bacterium]|nr:OmpA family protein [Polyangiaceae bacterium]
LKDNASIRHVRVQGHTDTKGTQAFNKRLSHKRAQAAVAWLLAHGIARDRLSAEGFGEERPIETNDTEGGRTANRRVEFHIESAGGTADGD